MAELIDRPEYLRQLIQNRDVDGKNRHRHPQMR